MATSAELEDRIAHLEAMKAKGVLEMSMGNERLKFASRKELQSEIADLRAQLSGRNRSAFGVTYAVAGRGL